MEATHKETVGEAFVHLIRKKKGLNGTSPDTGFLARLKRADNPDLGYQAWDILLGFNVDIEKKSRCLPFCLIGAAFCRQKNLNDGQFGLGEALRSCFPDDADQGSLRLRRLLACQTTEEACRMLRPLLALVASKATKPLCLAGLLDELLYFESSRQDAIRMRWARDFHRPAQHRTDASGDAV